MRLSAFLTLVFIIHHLFSVAHGNNFSVFQFSTAKNDSDSVIVPKSIQVGNISSSRIDFEQALTAGTNFDIPALEGLAVSANISGSLILNGVLASEVENITENTAKNVSRNMYRFFLSEREQLKCRAKQNYFTFLQAATNFGYTNSTNTTAFMDRWGFLTFNQRISRTFNENTFAGKQVRVHFRRQVDLNSSFAGVRVQGAVQVNDVNFTSGKMIRILKQPPLFVLFASDGRVIEEFEGESELL